MARPATENPVFLRETITQRNVRYLYTPIICTIGPVIVIIRLVVITGSLFIFNLLAHITEIGSSYPASNSPCRTEVQKMLARILGSVMNGVQLLLVRKKGKLDRSARVLVFNHSTFNDVPTILQNFPCSCVTKAELAGPWIFRIYLQMCRALLVVRNASCVSPTIRSMVNLEKPLSQQMAEHLQNQYLQLGIFPEGSIAAPGYMLRFRTGAFQLGTAVQPICIRYKTLLPFTWTSQHWAVSLLYQLANPFGILQITFLDTVEKKPEETPREFADRVGQSMAKTLGYQYTQYYNSDIIKFMRGHGEYSEAWAHDFGWMGSMEDFCQYCGVNPQLGVKTWQINDVKIADYQEWRCQQYKTD